jgi:hypothetical protein
MVLSIIYGAIVGAGRSLYKYNKLEDTDFDWSKFFKTAIIGAAIGGIASYYGATFEVMSTNLETIGLLTIIDFGAIAITNAVLKKIYNGLSILKDKVIV